MRTITVSAEEMRDALHAATPGKPVVIDVRVDWPELGADQEIRIELPQRQKPKAQLKLRKPRFT
jgi:hypothetical protein